MVDEFGVFGSNHGTFEIRGNAFVLDPSVPELGIGVDRAIDAVGVDAVAPHHGPGVMATKAERGHFAAEAGELAKGANPRGGLWRPGDAPSQALVWAVQALAKAGTLSIVGVYPQGAHHFPIGEAMNKNLTVNMGNCNHRKYIPKLLDLVRSGAVEPSAILTHVEPMTAVLDAYRAFDTRQPGWIKVEIVPESDVAAA